MRRVLQAAALALGAFLLWLLAVWPPPLWYRTHWPRRTAFMTRAIPAPRGPARARRAAGNSVDSIRYRPVPLDSIAPAMQDAVIIGEDNNFRVHGGIDYLALARALGYRRPTLDLRNARDRDELLAVLPEAWSRRDRLRGASTISQQLAKNLYLSPSRNPLRKLKEAVITWRLEAALGKRRIMELYLNVVELGDRTFGVEAASERYFHRPARELTQEQAAALAGSLPFPLRSNPGFRPGRMRWRQNLILRRMRGEAVEVPQVEAEETPPPEPPDSLGPAALPESLMADTTLMDTTPVPESRPTAAPPEPVRPDSSSGAPARPDSAAVP